MESGWKHCQLVFKPDIEFKERVTALRFILNANYNEDNKLYLANIALTEYSDVEYENPGNNNINQTPEENGCSGSVVPTFVTLVVLLSSAVVILLNKKGWEVREK